MFCAVWVCVAMAASGSAMVPGGIAPAHDGQEPTPVARDFHLANEPAKSLPAVPAQRGPRPAGNKSELGEWLGNRSPLMLGHALPWVRWI